MKRKKTTRRKNKTVDQRRIIELEQLIGIHERRIREAEGRNVTLLDMLRNSEEARTVLARWIRGGKGE